MVRRPAPPAPWTWANSPLAPLERTIRCSVRDYWGAGQAAPLVVPLVLQPRQNGPFVYTAEVPVAPDVLSVGKFYELHVEVPQATGEPVAEYSGFAVLPLAVTKRSAVWNDEACER